jgi:hypothetical protein
MGVVGGREFLLFLSISPFPRAISPFPRVIFLRVPFIVIGGVQEGFSGGPYLYYV